MSGVVAAPVCGTGTAPGLTMEVVTNYETFVRLEQEWNHAVGQAHVTHPFVLHEWFRSWWDSFGSGRRLHIVIARDGGDIVGIAPMMVEQVHMYGLPIRKLDLIHNDQTPRADWIVVRSVPRVFEVLWSGLHQMRDEWDLLQLSRLPTESLTRAEVTALAQRDGCQTGTWRGDVSPYLTLTGTWDSYLASLPAKFRSNLRNRLSRLLHVGGTQLEVVDGVDEKACEDAIRLEASGWKVDAHTSISSNASVQQFYRLLAERAAARGWLRLLFLVADGRRIAAAYGARFGDTLFFIKTGYDPGFAPCSPFKLLTYLAIQRAYADGLREVDFLGNSEPWKREWTNTSRPHDWLCIFAGTIRARLLHSLKFQVAPELKRCRA